MAKNMTFNAAIKLRTNEFKKGIKEIQSSLKGLQRTFLGVSAALGAGLGLNKLLSGFKDTAVQFSVAKNVLENVSKVTKTFVKDGQEITVAINNYGENMKFVKGLSEEYSQDLIALTNSFGQFHAACEQTNITLDQQKDIFEALTRASAYFHMSADQTRDMQNAIVQMASKGKVAAEELRRQLGNNLPGAFNIMAAALGLSTKQLDEMMRKGQVLSEDALPKFAAMLNTVTKGANFDSLQLSMNRLKNSWTEMVDNSGFENIYKGMIQGAEKVVKWFSTNFWGKILGIGLGIGAGLRFPKTTAWFIDTSRTVEAETEKMVAAYDKLRNSRNKAEKDITSKWAHSRGYGKGYRYDTNLYNDYKQNSLPTIGQKPSEFLAQEQEQIDKIIEYNKNLLETDKLRKKLYGKPLFTKKETADLKNTTDELIRFRTSLDGSNKSLNKFAGLGNVAMGILKNIGMAALQMGANILVGLAVGSVVKTIAKWTELADNIKKASKLYDEYKSDVKTSNSSVEKDANILMSHLNIIRDTNNQLEVRKRSLKEINKLTGSKFTMDALDKTKQAYKDIVKEVHRWIEATRLQAKVQLYATKSAEAEAQRDIMDEKFHAAAAEAKAFEEQAKEPFTPDYTKAYLEGKAITKKQEAKAYLEAMVQYGKIVRDAKAKLDELNVEIVETIGDIGDDGGGGGGKAQGIQKIFEDDRDAVKELKNELKEGAISLEEFLKEYNKLTVNNFKKAAATGEFNLADVIAKHDKGETLSAMEEWYRTIAWEAREIIKEELQEGIEEDIIKAAEEAIKKVDEELGNREERYDKANKADINNLMREMPDFKPRDTTFDYKKETAEVLEEEIEAERNWAKDLQSAIDDIEGSYKNIADASDDVKEKLREMTATMNRAIASADNLEAAMKFQKIKEDIEEMRSSLTNAYASGLKGLASDMDRVVKGMESIRDLMEDDDATLWEKFIAIFNEITQIADMVVGVINTLDKVGEISNKIAGAEVAQNLAIIELQKTKVNLERELFIWKSKNAGLSQKAIAAEIAEAGASRANASAKGAEAVAGATSSAAKLPFPWNLAAIAVAVATVLAALTGGKNIKFANGGIVGGNSFSGDNQLARVNSGEMILNRGQQKNLFNAINSGNLGGGGNVEFKIRGADLVGTLNNYNRIRKG